MADRRLEKAGLPGDGRYVGDYTSRGGDRRFVGWVQPTGHTPFTVGCTHPTNVLPLPARSVEWRACFSGFRGRVLPGRTPTGTRWHHSTVPPVLSRSVALSPRGAKAVRHAPKGDEWYEARDLRIVPVDSHDPEVSKSLRRFARLERPFQSGEQSPATPVGRKQNERAVSCA